VKKERLELRQLLGHYDYSTSFFLTVKKLFPLLLEDEDESYVENENPFH
jgi:hypothetical protein